MGLKRIKLVYFVSILPLVGLVPWMLFLPFSPMMFDAPGSEKKPWNWFAFLSCLIYPVIVGFGFKLVSRATKCENLDKATIGMLVSYLAPILVAISIVLMNHFCAGKSVC